LHGSPAGDLGVLAADFHNSRMDHSVWFRDAEVGSVTLDVSRGFRRLVSSNGFPANAEADEQFNCARAASS
jgi:hypothetical protein